MLSIRSSVYCIPAVLWGKLCPSKLKTIRSDALADWILALCSPQPNCTCKLCGVHSCIPLIEGPGRERSRCCQIAGQAGCSSLIFSGIKGDICLPWVKFFGASIRRPSACSRRNCKPSSQQPRINQGTDGVGRIGYLFQLLGDIAEPNLFTEPRSRINRSGNQ